MVLKVHINHKAYSVGTGRRGGRGYGSEFLLVNIHGGEKAYQGRVYGGGGEGDYAPIATLAVTTRKTPALRWAAMRAILMFYNCEGQSHKTASTDHNFTYLTDFGKIFAKSFEGDPRRCEG